MPSEEYSQDTNNVSVGTVTVIENEMLHYRKSLDVMMQDSSLVTIKVVISI